ncbi:hypothetical protein L3Q82_001593 [Scortum barcoo]|uniref:Uncharacterized protein n=1 Tax=Scortum barcoo TaxID=214431 RepID=A0ACB8W9Q9_9TELE|nr:hypothetical protein L3Q82_001593 [Scortum barcoo]
MATEDGGDVQRAEKVTLKRKLTGPPRLLLGKTRTRSVGKDRPEANKDRVENTDSDAAKLTGTANMDKKFSSVVTTESSGGCCGAAGEEDDIRNWKTSRRKWWRRFLPAALGNSKQKMDVKKGHRKQPSDGSVPPEGALQDTDADSLNNTEETTEHASKRKRGFDVRGWTTFKGFLTSEHRMNKLKKDFVEKDGDGSSTAFRKKLSRFFTGGGVRQKQTDGNRQSSGVPLENMEDSLICKEASSAAHIDKSTVM